MQPCNVCMESTCLNSCKKCGLSVCKECFERSKTDRRSINPVCCDQKLYDIRLYNHFVDKEFTSDEKKMIHEITCAKKSNVKIYNLIFGINRDAQSDLEFLMHYEKNQIAKVLTVGKKKTIVCNVCEKPIRHEEDGGTQYVKCCGKEQILLALKPETFEKIITYYDNDRKIEEYLNYLNSSDKKCVKCGKHTDSSSNFECCGTYQCLVCGFSLDSESNYEEFKNHDCSNQKVCVKCKRMIVKESGCDYISCVCGYLFRYSNRSNTAFQPKYVQISRLSKSGMDRHRQELAKRDIREKILYILLNFCV